MQNAMWATARMEYPSEDSLMTENTQGLAGELATGGLPDVATEIQRHRADARRQVSSAEQALVDARRAEGFWEALLRDLNANRPAAMLLTLREAGDYLLRLQRDDRAAAQLVDALKSEVEAKAKDQAAKFGRQFPELVRKQDFSRQFPIDPTSRHPRYTFEHSFLQVDVDERQCIAKITPRDGDEIVIGLDVEQVVKRVGEELVRLFLRQPDLGALLRSIYTAYVAVLRAENRPEGDAVPLRRVSNRLAKNVNRFAADEFNVDLARLLQDGKTEIEGKRLHVDHTRNARQGMLLHAMEVGGYVGFISFKHDS